MSNVWYYVIGVVVVIIAVFIALQFKSFKQWLVWGCSEAEMYFGSKTGRLKLRYVYDLAIQHYPFVARIITFDMFAKFVDGALVKMKEMIDTNEAIARVMDVDVKMVNVDDRENS